ncbi:hypothetical protein G6F37_011528 [Rhizopus arrhizus]|nr:hypothetical protein G6F38_011601 [Rhizopus arrhizus]KAG1148875.1 hypothetical protein G6F37_011528 [Rhizopus arrhizus]
MSNESLRNTPPETSLHVNLIRVLGIHITRPSFLHNLTANVFNATTTKEVLQQVKQVGVQLARQDIFQDIELYLDTSREGSDRVNMTVLLKEKEKGFLKSQVDVNHNQAELSAGLGIRNIFGGGESVYSSFSFGNYTHAAAETIIETPLFQMANIKLGISVNGFIKDHSQINAFEEATRSLDAHLKGWNRLGEHQIGYVIAERDIVPYHDASPTVRARSGSHFKHSVYHKFVRDERNDILLPTQGHYFRLFQEVAGLKDQGDISYVKHELDASYHQPLTQSVSLSTSVRAGVLTHVSKTLCLLDRFYLGGPLSVRGFKMGGIGERDENDAVGGEAYWAAGASLISAIPGFSHLPIKMHAFANAGSLVTKTSKTNELAQTPRASIGLGLILHHSIARIEANYCIPLRYSTSDSPEPKFQFGIGLNFL